jgi:hypothetical protein
MRRRYSEDVLNESFRRSYGRGYNRLRIDD